MIFMVNIKWEHRIKLLHFWKINWSRLNCVEVVYSWWCSESNLGVTRVKCGWMQAKFDVSSGRVSHSRAHRSSREVREVQVREFPAAAVVAPRLRSGGRQSRAYLLALLALAAKHGRWRRQEERPALPLASVAATAALLPAGLVGEYSSSWLAAATLHLAYRQLVSRRGIAAVPHRSLYYVLCPPTCTLYHKKLELQHHPDIVIQLNNSPILIRLNAKKTPLQLTQLHPIQEILRLLSTETP